MLFTRTATNLYSIVPALAVAVLAQTGWCQIPSPTIEIKPPIDNEVV